MKKAYPLEKSTEMFKMQVTNNFIPNKSILFALGKEPKPTKVLKSQ